MNSNEGLRAVAIAGSPSRHSKSTRLLQWTEERLGSNGVITTTVELARLPADGLLGRASAPEVTDAIGAIADAHIVVAATPVYRATYSGLLKVFFDLLPPSALAGKIGIPIATGGAAGHQQVLDYGLRPLFASLGGITVPTATYAVDAQFSADGPDPLLLMRLERAVNEAIELVRSSARMLSPLL
jgi:FMN reductase